MSGLGFKKPFPISYLSKPNKHSRHSKSNIKSISEKLNNSSISSINRFVFLRKKLIEKTISQAEWDEWFALSFTEEVALGLDAATSPKPSPFSIPPILMPPPLPAASWDEESWDKEPMDASEAAANAPAKK